MLSWLAHIIKKPCVLTKRMLILYSDKQQIGKGIIAEWLITQIFGMDVAGKTEDLDKVTGRFNSFIDRKVFTVLDDASSQDSYHSGTKQLKTKEKKSAMETVDLFDLSTIKIIKTNQIL